jgi:hypothetical protein
MADYAYSYIYTYSAGTISGETATAGVLSDANASNDGIFQLNEFIDVSNPAGAGAYKGYLTGTDAIVIGNKVYSPSPLAETTYTLNTGDFAFCLLAGTLVLCPEGERPVESLAPGDLVLTAGGATAEIRWVGRQTMPRPALRAAGAPVRITAGALADGVPMRDLLVSPDHAVLVDGLLVNARALVNGTTIRQSVAEAPAQVTFLHLELDRHDIIVADGAPVESFLDDVSRAGFDNFDEWQAAGLTPLPADPAPYLRVKSARQLPPRLRESLADRAASAPEPVAV